MKLTACRRVMTTAAKATNFPLRRFFSAHLGNKLEGQAISEIKEQIRADIKRDIRHETELLAHNLEKGKKMEVLANSEMKERFRADMERVFRRETKSLGMDLKRDIADLKNGVLSYCIGALILSSTAGFFVWWRKRGKFFFK